MGGSLPRAGDTLRTVSSAGRSVPRFPAAPPRSRGPSAPLHGDRAEAFVETLHLDPQLVGVLTAAAGERFQALSGVIPDPPFTARAADVAAGVDVASGSVKAFGVLDFASPQVEVPQSSAVFPRAAGTMPVHRRGRESPFCSMCVMCGAVTWRGR